MQVLLQQPAAPPGILSRLARAFQGNSFTPCLQTICYCSRRSLVGRLQARWHHHRWVALVPTRSAARHQPIGGERGRNRAKGCGTGWLGRHQPRAAAAKVFWCIGEVLAGGGMLGWWNGSHQKHPFLTYSKSQGHTAPGSWQNVDLQCLIFADSQL